MESSSTTDSPVEQPATDRELTAFDIDAITALAEFEAEHRRVLAMQMLYYRRNKAGGVA